MHKNIEQSLAEHTANGLKALFNLDCKSDSIHFSKTKKEHKGDFTLVVFPYTKAAQLSPEQTAQKIGEYIQSVCSDVSGFNVIKGFLNIELNDAYWIHFFNSMADNSSFGTVPVTEKSPVKMVEYCGPNTNKPLHLGHVRNCLLGVSVCEILNAAGNKVVKVNIVNDRGVHICKSMLAWQKYGNGETPESSGMKGDHLVGKYYVEFDKHYKLQVQELIAAGKTKEEAEKEAPLMVEVQHMLTLWEANDAKVKEVWNLMNSWVYAGFDITFKKLGVSFDKVYYESQTYLLGKGIVDEGLKKNVFFTKDDHSVWIDLSADGLDQKLVQRGNGTSVYITQDIGTAVKRAEEFNFDNLIYVVGNEQDYHFKVLFKILDKMQYPWAKGLSHLSYGMVELPEGKMKSREGTVVDADDLVDEMIHTATETTTNLGKIEGLSEADALELNETIAMGALKYFILKVDPKKKMLFNPAESIDFNGNTGPYIQYTHARIRSVLRKANLEKFEYKATEIESIEKEILRSIYDFPAVIQTSAKEYSPAVVANYLYELVKLYNQFYHDISILKETDSDKRNFRLALSLSVANIIRNGLFLLGVKAPDRM